jgi:hypothetical protein
MNIHELDTPAVVVDLDVMERNLARMADYCRSKDLDCGHTRNLTTRNYKTTNRKRRARDHSGEDR